MKKKVKKKVKRKVKRKMKRKMKMKRKKKKKKKAAAKLLKEIRISEFGSAAWQKYFIAFHSEIVIGKK